MLKTLKKATPEGVPDGHVMDPFDVKSSYLGEPCATVLFELGKPEVGSTNEPVERLGSDIEAIFTEVGLPAPVPVRVMSAEHQIIQKIHACTGPDATSRAHDLVDIQMLLADVPRAERRERLLQAVLDTFRYRETAWPATVVQQPRWDTLYEAATHEVIGVLPDVRSAISWANELIGDIGT